MSLREEFIYILVKIPRINVVLFIIYMSVEHKILYDFLFLKALSLYLVYNALKIN